MSRAIVIGAGFGGLAAALRLRHRGYDVTIVEAGNQPGGRARVFQPGRIHVRRWATPLITAPHLFDELFQLFGKERSDYVGIPARRSTLSRDVPRRRSLRLRARRRAALREKFDAFRPRTSTATKLVAHSRAASSRSATKSSQTNLSTRLV